MRARIVAALTGSALALGLLASGSAAAAVTVGSGCIGGSPVGEKTTVSLIDDASSPFQRTVPSGVITSWSVRNSFTELAPTQQLKVFRPTGVKHQLLVVGESDFEPIVAGPNTFPTRIPVEAGDLIGMGGFFSKEGETVPGSLICRETPPGDLIGAMQGNPPAGSTVMVTFEETTFSSPVAVTVEPDADGDGYGDETQDQCPTDASTQGPCQVPPASGTTGPTSQATSAAPPAGPPRLTATGVAKKRSLVVTVNSTAAASVTIVGTVRLGNVGTVGLAGGTQAVVPGVPTSVIIRFPKKMAKALKHLAPGDKYYLHLTASAPGAAPAKLVVKVHGQEPRPEQHHLM